jgi:hypothetical protein
MSEPIRVGPPRNAGRPTTSCEGCVKDWVRIAIQGDRPYHLMPDAFETHAACTTVPSDDVKPFMREELDAMAVQRNPMAEDITLQEFADQAPRLRLRVSVVTQEKINTTVAERWKGQYYDREGADRWMIVGRRESSKVIYDKLCALGANATVEAIAAIIGNDSWTNAYCSACEKPTLPVVLFERFSEHSDSSEDTHICSRCIALARGLLVCHEAVTEMTTRDGSAGGGK